MTPTASSTCATSIAPRRRAGESRVSLGTIAMRFLQGRFVATALTAVSVALGAGLVIASVLLTRGVKESFIEGTTDYNLIVGAKGSSTQLVLNVVFRLDT